jgi:hypothetical protein
MASMARTPHERESLHLWISLDKTGRLIVERVDGSTAAFDPATGRAL